MKSLFRIDNVLRGDAPTVALLGTDGDGRAIRLELPSAAVGSLRPGEPSWCSTGGSARCPSTPPRPFARMFGVIPGFTA
jgi:hypothetical protein